jgi:chaperone protein EcpD
MSRLATLGVVLCLATGTASGDIVIDRTRIIYLATEREVSVTLNNRADSPRLVQAWIDAGNPQVAPEYSDVPFTLTPPIFRIEPGRGQALRIISQSTAKLATESVFWLNVLSIRPSPDAAQGNTLQWAFRTRIKLFLRPTHCPEPALQWRLISTAPVLLQVYNPSLCHVTLSRVVLTGAGHEYRNDDPPMVAPATTQRVALSNPQVPLNGSATLRFSLLDDYAIAREYEQPLKENPLHTR